MTPIEFQFNYPDGEPIANAEFVIKLPRSGFIDAVDGVIMPATLVFTTDALGMAVVSLAPSSSVYTVRMSAPLEEGDDGLCHRGINYKFYVPNTTELVRAQDLFMAPPPNSEPWDEEAMGKITQAMQDTQDNADRALDSAQDAAASATAANASKVAAANSATASTASAAASLASQQAAAVSATNAANSATASANKATESTTAAASALASKDAAAVTANASAQSAAEALASKNTAVTSATNATASAGTATTKAAEASASASTATTQASTATSQAGIAKTEADRARTAADEASNKQPLNGNLTALAAQNGRADTFAFFTGPSAMTATPLTTQGRILLAQATPAAMRTQLEMGSIATYNVVTSGDDNTPNRVTTVGYAGIGCPLSTRVLGSGSSNRHDAILKGMGFSVGLISSGDMPVGVVDGPIITMDYDGVQGMNIMYDWRTGTSYTFTDITPAPLKKWRMQYHEDNVVGLIISKAIIERGQNVNGEWTKFADGTIILRIAPKTTESIPVNTFISTQVQAPQALIDSNGIQTVTATCRPTQNSDHYGVISTSTGDGGIQFNAVIRNGSTVAQTFILNVTVIGKWK